MKQILIVLLATVFANSYSQSQVTDCQKMGFETGKGFLGWYGYINESEGKEPYSDDPWNTAHYYPLYNENNSSYPTSIKAGADPVERFVVLNKSATIKGRDTLKDPITNKINLVSPSGSNSIIRLGNSNTNSFAEGLEFVFKVTEATKVVSFYYAIVLEEPNHSEQRPYFYSEAFHYFSESYEKIPCSNVKFVGDRNQFKNLEIVPYGGKTFLYKNWSLKTIDFSAYMGETVSVSFFTADCGLSAHAGYAYIDLVCSSSTIDYTGKLCTNNPVRFSSGITGIYADEIYSWDFGDGTAKDSRELPTHSFSYASTYTVKLTVTRQPVVEVPVVKKFDGPLNLDQILGDLDHLPTPVVQATAPACNTRTASVQVTIAKCVDQCEECVSSFSPIPNGKYLLSAWVKEDYSTNIPDSYTQSGIKIGFNRIPTEVVFTPAGPIIDGWQRIEWSFTVPSDAQTMQITLVNTNENRDAYFDDVRIHPFNSNMKSFVYDAGTQKLTAELDENNYATQYEYDDEGSLIRVKKETERGVFTVRETRNNQSKINSK